MKVCMVTYSFYESDSRIMQYAKALTERGDSVDVIALQAEETPKQEVIDGVSVFRIRSRKVNEKGARQYAWRILLFLATAFLFFARRRNWNRYDVIHVHSVPDFLVFSAAIPKYMGTSVVLDVHDILPEFCASKFGIKSDSIAFRMLMLVEKFSVGFADHVIAANEIWRDRMICRSTTASKCTAIRNYPDPSIFHPYPRPSCQRGEKFIFLYPGTLNYHQGLDVALRAFARVADQMPDAEFHIYGEGPEKTKLIALRNSLHLESRVIFHGMIPWSEIANVMARADMAVVPKRVSSGFGNEAASTKILEFMYLGVPLIVSRTRIDSYYHDDSMVRFVTSDDDRELSEAMLEMWLSPELRSKIAENALRYAAQYRWETRKEEYLTILDNLRQEKHPESRVTGTNESAHA